MPWSVADAHCPPDQELEYRSVKLRLSGLVELLVSHRDNTHMQLTVCARHYKEQALRELYPHIAGLSGLTVEKRYSVIQRAIEMAIDDSRARRSVF